ncbi:MAG: flagellar biosynthesis protein FlhA, partial [Bryobacterales bacterium]|nr:flagellar biosynthesis protein FlhA [Bryobacterales bacterium]
VEHGELSSHLQLGVEGITRILDAAGRVLDARDQEAVLLVSAGSRPFVSQILETSLPGLAILSHNEIPPGIRLLSRGTVQ